MKIINPSVEIISPVDRDFIFKLIEEAGRTAYRSEDKITSDSAPKFVKKIMELGHESVIEHYGITSRFIIDRGVSHELVRHRLASYTQESTRFCNYEKDKFGNEISVILPTWAMAPLQDTTKYDMYVDWHSAMLATERAYFTMLKHGATPQEARAVLPNALKTEIVVTANLRELRLILNTRCTKKAHPDMRYIMLKFLDKLNTLLPEVFNDIYKEHFNQL